MNGIRVYIHQNIPFVHISAFAAAVRHSYSNIRRMMEREQSEHGEGGALKRRPLKYFRDGSTLWIPTVEITGYPFIKGTNVYHYTEDGQKYLCTKCTFGAADEMCDKAREARDLVVPVGDP